MQGDIWSNLPQPYSPSPLCAGLVITPRCDLVHDKTLTANYLPLFPIDEFMETRGHHELLEQGLHDAKELLRRAADPLGVKGAVELELPMELLTQALTENPSARASELGIPLHRYQKLADDFWEAKRRIDAIGALLLQARVEATQLTERCNPKSLRKYKLALARNTVSDLHFLPPCRDLLLTPCVISLRDVATCSVDLLRIAGNCMSQGEWDASRSQQSTPDFKATSVKPERLLRLKTPYLEHLMSRFGALFGRVGVRDMSASQLEAYIGLREL
jgi:hypothetical protein